MYIKQTIYFFAVLCVLFIPVQFNFFSIQQNITDGLFGGLIQFFGELLNVEIKNTKVSSDSASMYLLALILFFFALLISFSMNFSAKWKDIREKSFAFLRIVFCYYLSVQLFKYGFDKVFKYQFYLPEPNILYTPVGNLSKDFLYWTSMGTSYWYSVFAGLLEIIPACFLLFRKTRVLGLLIAMGVLINVIAINFGFDISVKLFSMFLLLLTLISLQPQFTRLYMFLVLHQPTNIKEEISFGNFFKNDSVAPTLKTLLICLCLMESMFPYAMARNFNDDTAKRPYLHGAYEITQSYTISLGADSNLGLKRFYVHRSGYIIFQNEKDQMRDFKLNINKEKKQFELTNYDGRKTSLAYNYNSKDSTMELQYFKQGHEYLLKAKALNWRKLPAIQNDFHWTVDGYE